jgi:hypothetical protein
MICAPCGEFESVTSRKPASFNCLNPYGTSGCAGIVANRISSSTISGYRIETLWIEPIDFSTASDKLKNGM